jgi:hypothetical protein
MTRGAGLRFFIPNFEDRRPDGPKERDGKRIEQCLLRWFLSPIEHILARLFRRALWLSIGQARIASLAGKEWSNMASFEPDAE